MAEIRDKAISHEQQREANPQLGLMRRVLRFRAKSVFKSIHFWILVFSTLILGYVYYGILTSYHDIYVVLFFFPMVYAAVTYRLRGVLVCGFIDFLIVAPHAIFLSHDIYALFRTMLYGSFAFIISSLSATLLNYLEMEIEAYLEIQSLNKELQSYTERLENTQRHLIHAEKLKAIGQIAASIAHEVNNPLAGIVVYTRLIGKKLQKGTLDKDEAIKQLDKIDQAVTYSSRIIRSLLDFSRRSEPEYKSVTISKVIEQALMLVGHMAVKKKIEVIREEPPDLPPARADFGQLQQVMINLITNAIQAMETDGKLIIRTQQGDDRWIKIMVIDNGTGITPENMDKLFTPFFSTKADVKGVGLGLWISYRIIENHGGKIIVDSQPGHGSTFSIYLPPFMEI